MQICRIARTLLIVGAAVSLTACEYSPDTAERTIEYNQAVAQSTNDLFLLNAIRASERNPTYYTRLLSNLASTTATPGLSSVIPWGSSKQLTVGPNSVGDIVATSVVSKAAATITPSLSLAMQNQLSLQNQDDQPSMNGLLSPVTLQQITNYRTEGFSPEELYLLYMGSIAISRSILTHLPDAIAETCARQKSAPSSYCQYFFGNTQECDATAYDQSPGAYCQYFVLKTRKFSDPLQPAFEITDFSARFIGACFGRDNVLATSRSDASANSEFTNGDAADGTDPTVVFPNDPAIDGIPTNKPHDMKYFKCFKQILTALLVLDLAPGPAPYKLLYRLPFKLAQGNPRYFADLTQQNLEIAADGAEKWIGVCKKPDSPSLSITADKYVQKKLGLVAKDVPHATPAELPAGTEHEDMIGVKSFPEPTETKKNDCAIALENAGQSDMHALSKRAKSSRSRQIKRKPPTTTPQKALKPSIAYVPRSLEGIVYFLGEIIRRKFDARTSHLDAVSFWNAADSEHPYDEELFRVEKGVLSFDSIATASNNGQHYFIPPLCPDGAAGRAPEGCSDEFPDHASAQVLTMLNQLWGLNKTATAPPVIPSVTVISPP